jgi:CMP-N-acetylneuraminic acid synthetase
MSTSPLTRPEDIDGTVELLLRRRAGCAFTATPFYGFVWEADSSGNMTGSNHTPRFRPRRQDRRPQYLETGAVYVMRARRFREAGHRFFGRTVAYTVPRERALEIDEPADLLLASALLDAQRGHVTPSRPYRPSRQAPLLEPAG